MTDKQIERIEYLLGVTRIPLWHPASSDTEYEDEGNEDRRENFRRSNNYLRQLEIIDAVPGLLREIKRLRKKVQP